jgi:hypothetical protein
VGRGKEGGSYQRKSEIIRSFTFQLVGIINGQAYKGLCKILPILALRKLVIATLITYS